MIMEYSDFTVDGVLCRIAAFPRVKGEAHGIFTIVRPGSASDEAMRLKAALDAAAERMGMRPAFMRWLLSDATNQASLLPALVCATSVIQQPPLDGSHAALFAIFEQNADYENLGHGIWKSPAGRIMMGDDDSALPGDSASMTRYYLEHLSQTLARHGGSLSGNCLRTWFFVRDIDNNYGGLVQARNKVFEAEGLTRHTHFIASTGIAGQSAQPRRLVAFNAMADLSVKPEQIRYLSALSHLSPTYDYGVAFERATAVDYPDRRHVYVSGTASIDHKGEIVFPGDIVGQTRRMLENIEMLLKEGQCTWSDVAHMIVYLRDIADYAIVSRIFAERFPAMPVAIVLAPVCRPGWLVETECMAISELREQGD